MFGGAKRHCGGSKENDIELVSWAKNAKNEEGSFWTPAIGEFDGKKKEAANLVFVCMCSEEQLFVKTNPGLTS